MIVNMTRDGRVNKAFEQLWKNIDKYGLGSAEVKAAESEVNQALRHSTPEIEGDIQSTLRKTMDKYRMLNDGRSFDEMPEEYRYAWFVFRYFNE